MFLSECVAHKTVSSIHTYFVKTSPYGDRNKVHFGVVG